MAKQFELIYSSQKTGFEQGRAYSNPRFFTTPREGVTKAYVVGKWPAVAEAYRAKGVDVVQCEPHEIGAILRGHPPAQFMPEAQHSEPPTADLVSDVPPEARGSIPIPEDWRELPWRPEVAGGPTIRALATHFSDTTILNKSLAVAAITAELARRAALAELVDEPEPAPDDAETEAVEAAE